MYLRLSVPSLDWSTVKVRQKEFLVMSGESFVDLNAGPFVPEGWMGVLEHRKGGMLAWDPKKIEFYRSRWQNGAHTSADGQELRCELQNKAVLNANLLDYLLQNPELIPDDWKRDERGNTQYIYFWGTIYLDQWGMPRIRGLVWLQKWCSVDQSVGRDWYFFQPAATLITS